MNNQLDERESLALIQSMINKAKNNYTESGTLYLVWGIVVLLCSLTHFVLSYFFEYERSYFVWFATWGVFAYQVYYLSNRKKKLRVKTYTDEILGYVWLCFIACFFTMIFILMYTRNFDLILTAILVVYGIPSFLSGAILKINLLMVGGISCWALAILSLFIPVQFHLLLISAAISIAWILPGWYMRKKYLKQIINAKQ
jgi:hypothetical protein